MFSDAKSLISFPPQNLAAEALKFQQNSYIYVFPLLLLFYQL